MAKKLHFAIAGLTAAVALAAFGYEVAGQSSAGTDDNGSQARPLQLVELGKTRKLPLHAPEGGYLPPVTFAPTPAEFQECSVLDINQDGSKWQYDSQGFKYNYHSSHQADDWCILPPVRLEAGTCKIEFSYKCASASYPEALKLFIGRQASVDGMTTEIVNRSSIKNTDYQTESLTVDIPESGEWYIGLYCYSEPNMFNLFVKDITIKSLDDNQPLAPSLSIAPDGLDCALTVTMPTDNLGGQPLSPESLDAKVYMDGTLLDGGEFSAAPGEDRVFSLNVGTSGVHTFTAMVSYELDGRTLRSEDASASHHFTKKQTLPTPIGYTFTPDEDEFAWCTVINSNNDASTWEYSTAGTPESGRVSESAFRYALSYYNPADDWLILPVFDGSESGAHQVTFNLANTSSEETMQVCMATEPTVEALSQNIIWDQAFNFGVAFKEQKAIFTVEEGQDFYIAFHATSPSSRSYIYLQNITVTKINGEAPAKPVITNTEFDGGNGTMTLAMPSFNIDGNPLSADKVYVETRLDGQIYGTDVESAPGQTATVMFNDLSIGEHKVDVMAYIYGSDNEKLYSEPASVSFKIRISSDFAYQLPLDLNLNNTVYDYFLFVNANNDYKEWTATESCFELEYNGSLAADDWFISPAVELNDATKNYELSISARNSSASYDEKVEVYIGREQSVEGMTQEVIPVTELKLQGADEWKELKSDFRIEEAGRYYIGVHGVSDRDKLKLQVRHLGLRESGVTPLSPAAVENLSAEGFETGELKADVSFTFPTKTFSGEELDINADLTATVRSKSETKTVVGKPGTDASLQIECPSGNSEILVSVSNESGESPSASIIVNCGLDRPKAPKLTALEVSEDNLSATIHFERVTEGVNGGHVNSSNIDYYLFEWDEDDEDWYQVDVQTDVTSLTYDVAAGTPQTFLKLGVQCYNGLNSGSEISPFNVVLGAPKELPITENFENGALHHSLVLGTSLPSYAMPNWTIVKPETVVEGAESSDGGYALYGSTGWSQGDTFISLAKFSTENIEHPTVQIVSYKHAAGCEITVQAAGYDSEVYEILGTIEVPATTEGWANLSFELPESLRNRKWVEVRLYVYFPNGSNSSSLIDAYRVLTSNPDGVDDITDGASARYVRGTKGALAIVGYDGIEFTVCDLSGQTVASSTAAEGIHYVVLEPGVYVVKAGADSYKVLVK